MPATTPKGLPYPLDTDPIAVAQDIQELAEAIDVQLGATIPVGTIYMWGTGTPPASHLVLAGAVVSRATYPELFALWGTTYGAGDGVNTFGLPNMTACFPVARLQGDPLFGTVGAKGGSRDIQLIEHLHAANSHGHGIVNHDHPADHAHSAYAVETDIVRGAGGGDAKLYSQNNNPGVAGYGPYNALGIQIGVNSTSGFRVGGSGNLATDVQAPATLNAGTPGNTGANGRIPPFFVVNFIVKAL